jgi:hypothetical protein
MTFRHTVICQAGVHMDRKHVLVVGMKRNQRGKLMVKNGALWGIGDDCL